MVRCAHFACKSGLGTVDSCTKVVSSNSRFQEKKSRDSFQENRYYFDVRAGSSSEDCPSRGNAEEMHFRLRSKVRGTRFLDFARNDGGEGPVFLAQMRRDYSRAFTLNEKFRRDTPGERANQAGSGDVRVNPPSAGLRPDCGDLSGEPLHQSGIHLARFFLGHPVAAANREFAQVAAVLAHRLGQA